PSQVSASQLQLVFSQRLNPLPEPPPHFDESVRSLNKSLSRAIPLRTTDASTERFFSREISELDVALAKKHVRRRHSKGARGVDAVSYEQIMTIPNTVLAALFNRCLLIGLESCLLKMLTLIIDKRVREWAEAVTFLPDSQNGFREKYRTHNNSFILRSSIDEARANGKPLYVAFIDLKNAFPSTDLPTLWLKLWRAGISGPLFD
ncbi:hypothetical protein BT96DRAFT_783482, partial [Gymnopus androsaceus JB14]